MNTYTGEVKSYDELNEQEKQSQVWKPIDTSNLTAAQQAQLAATGRTNISRNSQCPCGSRKRFKRCCMRDA